MNTKTAVLAAGLTALACAGPLQAHHSGFMYSTTPIWVRGAVVGFERAGPHTLMTLEDRTEEGQVRRWAVEGPPASAIERMGTDRHIPAVGEVVEFCAFPYKPVEELARIFPGADFSNRRALALPDGSSPRYVAGHVMTTAGAERTMWEPHGILAECIRGAGGQTQSWLGFVNASTEAHDAWCSQQSYTVIQTAPTLREFVDTFDALLDSPCTKEPAALIPE